MSTARLAKKADSLPAPAPGRQRLKKRCACGKHTPGGEACEECKQRDEEVPTLRRRAAGAGPATAPPIVGDVLRGSGQALPADVRAAVEPRFGRDFGHVRVHTGPQAADSARAVQARAYTVGDHVVFGAGEYAPHTPDGLWLLSHELAHVSQQGGVQRVADEAAGLLIGSEHDAAEHQADRAADAVVGGGRPHVAAQPGGLRLRRAPATDCAADAAVLPVTGELASLAEKLMVFKYLDQGGSEKSAVAHNFGNKLNQMQAPEGSPAATAQRTFYEHFRQNPRRARQAAEPSAESADALLEAVNNFLVETSDPALKEPDILDFQKLFVFDVTTEGETPAKVGKIKDTYVRLLNYGLVSVNPTAVAALRAELEARGFGPNTPPGQRPKGAALTKAVRESADKVISTLPSKWQPGSFPAAKDACFPADATTLADPRRIWFGRTVDGTGVLTYTVLDVSQKKGAVPTEPFPVEFQEKDFKASLTFDVTAGEGDTDLTAQADARKVPGLLFFRMRRGRGGAGAVLSAYGFADLDPAKIDKLLAGESLKDGLRYDYKAVKGKPLVPVAFKKVRKVQLKFSEADLTTEFTPAGLVASGPVRTTVPLLKNAPLFFTLGPNLARLDLRGDAKKISPPIPGLRVTDASLAISALPDLAASGQVAVAFGPAGRPYVTGVLAVTFDETGLALGGDVVGHIPGLDEAKGQVAYKNGQLSGSLNLATSQVRLPVPGVTVNRVGLTATVTNEGLVVGGDISATLPGNTPVTLSATRRDGRVVYTGTVSVNVPKLKPVDVAVSYDGEHFSGSAKTGVAFAGLSGDVTIHYRDGEVYGEGTVAITKGKLNGSMNLKLSKEHRLSGEGKVQYPLTDKLVGTIGVRLAESGRFTVLGGLRITQPIELFRGFQDKVEKELFHQLFPVPGLSLPVIGGVGVDVSVRAGFDYGVGPGTLSDVAFETQFDPFEENTNLSLKGGAKFDIPAHAGVFIKFSGGIGVGNNFVSASGGLTIEGRIGVDGGFHAAVGLEYSNKRFVLEAQATIEAGLTVTVTLSVYVEGRALSWTGRKEWELAGFRWGSGARLEVTFPVRYASDEPFRPPSLDAIKVKLPEINVPEAVKALLGQARTEEKPGK